MYCLSVGAYDLLRSKVENCDIWGDGAGSGTWYFSSMFEVSNSEL